MVHTNGEKEYNASKEIMLQTTHKDVVLDFFKGKKIIFGLRSGTKLKRDNVYLSVELNGRDVHVAKFSKAFCEMIENLRGKGFEPSSAEVRFVVAWKGEDDTEETPILLTDMYFVKT